MDSKKEPTQQTPQGHEIPVPTREQVERDFAKVARPVEPKRKLRRRKRSTGK